MTLFFEVNSVISTKDYRFTVATILYVVFQFSGNPWIGFYATCWTISACWFSDDKDAEERK
jgi:hypothetical protein